MAFQGLAKAAAAGESAIFLSFEEDPGDIVKNFGNFSWDLEGHIASGRLTVLDARLRGGTDISGPFELDGLLGVLKASAERTGATRLVLDGLDILLAQQPSARGAPAQLFAIDRFARERGIGTLVTLKTEDLGAGMAIAPFLGDCVIKLDRRLEADMAINTLEVQKYRGSPTPAVRVPMTVDEDGIILLYGGGQQVKHLVSEERVSSGIDRLDTMLGGGYYRGTTILISGAPGTAKTTLAGTMLAATCEAGGRGLLVSFDEADGQIVRNLRSVGVDLAPHVASGSLAMQSLRAAMAPAQFHAHRICRAIEAFRPDLLVIDPISALMKAGGREVVHSVVEVLVDFVKSRGITTIFTALVESENPEHEWTQSHVSTIADSWLHLTFVIHGGERNRALSVVKSRGSAHSNQVRELLLGADGPTLADVYTVGGQVLMGTARLEREAEAAISSVDQRYETLKRRATEMRAIDEAQARIDALQVDMQLRRQALAMLDEFEKEVERISLQRAGAVLRSRVADGNGPDDGERS